MERSSTAKRPEKVDGCDRPKRFVDMAARGPLVVVKGRNRDTAWLSITDAEWPRLAAAYERWLAPDNFEPEGGQRLALSKLTVSDPPPER